jgi:hypothetical protein
MLECLYRRYSGLDANVWLWKTLVLLSCFFFQVIIGSFEEPKTTDTYEVIHHHVDGLDGKVSRLEVALFKDV